MKIRFKGVKTPSPGTHVKYAFEKPGGGAVLEYLATQQPPSYLPHLVRLVEIGDKSIKLHAVKLDDLTELPEIELPKNPETVWHLEPSTIGNFERGKKEYAILFINDEFAAENPRYFAGAQADPPNKWPRGAEGLHLFKKLQAVYKGLDEKGKEVFRNELAEFLEMR